MTSFTIRDITRKDVPLLTPAMPIRRAVAALVDAKAAAAPVLSVDGALVGLLSQKDCFRPALHASYHREWSGQVAEYMTQEVVSVDLDADLIRVAEMFLAHPHRVFPVLRGSAVAGVVHRSDVLAMLLAES
jgi:CBS domain-containing protein